MSFIPDDIFSKFLCLIGFYVILKFIYSSYWFVYKTIDLYITAKDRLNPKIYGEWSVVTGATSGIGKSFAELLAKRGSNVVIIGRNEEILNQMKSDLESTYKVQVQTIIKDFTNDDYGAIKQTLEGLDIGILVNNVGVAVSSGQELCSLGEETFRNVINTNILSCCMMTRIVLPTMIKKKKGVVVNVASFSSYYPLRYAGIYPSTKNFVNFFNETLIREYPFENFGIYFNCINPFYVATKMSKKRPNMLIPSADQYAESALDTFEHSGESNGCMTHHLIATAFSLIPMPILDSVAAKLTREMKTSYENWKRKST